MADVTQYVTIGVADELYATPVERVQEILDVCPISRLPRAPAHVLGMIDVRGEGTPVFDMRALLELPPKADTENTRIVVLFIATEHGETRIGLRADRVIEVAALDSEELAPPPQMGRTDAVHTIIGIGRRNGAFVTVLDFDRLLAEDAMSVRAA